MNIRNTFLNGKTIFFLITIFALVLSANVVNQNQHVCIHEQLAAKYKPMQMHLPNFENRLLLEAVNKETAQPFRIVFNFDNLYNTVADAETTQKRDWIKNKLMPVAAQFLEKRILVNRVQGKLKYPYSNNCYEATVSESSRTEGYDADLVIFVSGKHEDSASYAAWAIHCVEDRNSGRPIFGQINFNLANTKVGDDQLTSKVSTTVHELFHVMGFSPNSYRKFIDENGNIRSQVTEQGTYRGMTNTRIVTPAVKKVAQQHYNCPTAQGVELENDGSSGSAGAHWERTNILNEMMTASEIANSAFSNFTMALLEDSGWYLTRRELAQPIIFGKNKGCDFLEKGCKMEPLPEEFCESGYKGCGNDGNFIGYCSIGQFTNKDQCHFFNGYSNGDCRNGAYNTDSVWSSTVKYYGAKFGPTSKCAYGDLILQGYTGNSPRQNCYEFSCVNKGTPNVELHFKVGSGTVKCTQKGEKASPSQGSGFSGTLTCPDPESYCSDYYPSCKDYCSGNGFCNLGKCECQQGWAGETCSQQPKVCPDNCSGNGDCNEVTGTCACSAGYQGDNCSQPTPKSCPDNCSGKGSCNTSTGVCTCYTGYQGDNCSQPTPKSCPDNCSGKGQCNTSTGVCTCNDGYQGENCSQPTPKSCPDNCSGNGQCLQSTGKCVCNDTYHGDNCGERELECPSNCSGHGVCDKQTGQCKCNEHYFDDDCGTYDPPIKHCPDDCNFNGECDNETGKCKCDEHYSGDSCDKKEGKDCPNDCNYQGECDRNTGTCTCDEGYTGQDCGTEEDEKKCPDDCSGNGECDTQTGKCHCDDKYKGENCSQEKCPNDCNRRYRKGYCDMRQGQCRCRWKWTGDDCSKRKCPGDCKGNGDCQSDGKCQCKENFYGSDCGRQINREMKKGVVLRLITRKTPWISKRSINKDFEKKLVNYVKNGQNISGYCTNNNVVFPVQASNNCPTGPQVNRNIGFEFTIEFNLAKAAKWTLQFGFDFTYGAVVYVDGQTRDVKATDLWWSRRWNHPDVFTVTTEFAAGPHKILIYGVERCCDGDQAIRVRVGDSGEFKMLTSHFLEEVSV